MTGSTAPATTEVLASFFKRLEGLEEIVRIVMSHYRMSALFTFRGEPEKKVLMDFSKSPAQVSVDNGATAGTVYATIDGDIMHEVFLDRKKPGVAVGRRELLLKGPVMAFSKIIPLFDIAPVLYREHLADIGYAGFARQEGKALSKEEVMSDQVFKGDPIPLVRMSGLESLGARVINGLAYGLGYAVGFLRYRLFKKLSLFGVLSQMSRGLEAATPPEQKNPPQG
jgi:hypothetical protein